MSSITGPRPNQRLIIALWVVQIVLAAFYAMVGVIKLSEPIPVLTAMMHWPAVAPEWFVRFIGAAELAGAVGLIAPAATAILPSLTTAAAAGLVMLQFCAAVFHVSRGELQVLPVIAVLLALAIFILWGRAKAPTGPRGWSGESRRDASPGFSRQ